MLVSRRCREVWFLKELQVSTEGKQKEKEIIYRIKYPTVPEMGLEWL